MTGPFPTGRLSYHWKDENREELETRAEGDRRELMVHLFYPAGAGATGERAAYVPDADVMRGPWSEEQIARIRGMRAHSVEGAPLINEGGRLPVAVFAPGGGMKALTYHALLEDLASHGWVVAAIDPPYNARSMRFPDGRVVGNLPAEERGWAQTGDPRLEKQHYIERIAHWARDIRFVIDQLEGIDRGDGPFGGRLDLERGVAALGHSRGGQAAAAVRLIDDRVRGGVNLDGTTEHAVLPIEGKDESGTQPFLWIQKPLPEPPSDERLAQAGRTRAEYDAEVDRIVAKWSEELGRIEGGALWVTFARPGISHIDYSDEPFWDGSITAETRPGKLETIAETRAWVRAFLEGTVRGDWLDLKELVEQAGDTKVQQFGRMWPN